VPPRRDLARLDPANTRKSLGQLVALLHLLDCDVEFVINPRHAA
jgi:hypothetical protein